LSFISTSTAGNASELRDKTPELRDKTSSRRRKIRAAAMR
jgi:hypothetical protein